MPANEQEPASNSPTDAELARRFTRAGTGILIVGLGCAALAYWRAVPDRDQALIAVLNNTKQYEYQMEQMGGKANLLATELNDGFIDQFHGTHLARTLTVLSVAASGACFFVAHRLAGGPRAAGT